MSTITTLDEAYSHIRSQESWEDPTATKQYQHVLPHATYSPWLSDAAFLKVYEKIKHNTLVDLYRCYELWTLAKQTANIEGNILEVGVWRGGTGTLLAEAVKHVSHKKVYLADTFTGVVKAGEKDTRYRGGEHADTSVEIVTNLVNSLGLENTKILQGIFPDDTADQVIGNICMLHCDVDVYASSKDIINWCLPRLPIGAIIVFDDYGFFGCDGVTTYCEELRENNDFLFLHNLNGHAVFVKVKQTQ